MPKKVLENISFSNPNALGWSHLEVNDALRQAKLIGVSDNLLEEDEAVINSAFMTWCLGAKGMSVDELLKLSERSEEERAELAREFLTELSEHDINVSENRDGNIEHAKWYGQMCAAAMKKIKEANIHFPTTEDLKDEKSREAFQDPKFILAAQIGRGWARMTGAWKHIGSEYSYDTQTPFLDHYGDASEFVKDQNVLEYAAALGSAFDTNLSATKQAYLNTMAKDQWLPNVAGKSFAEVAGEDTMLAGSMAYGKMQAVREGDFFGFDRLSGKEQKMLLQGASAQPVQHSEQASAAAWQKEKATALLDVTESIRILEKVKAEPLPRESDEIRAEETNGFWMDAHELNEEDLDKAAELFDRLFQGMKAPGKEDLIKGFRVGGHPVGYYLEKGLKEKEKEEGKELAPGQRSKYEKALVVLALKDPRKKAEVEYRPYPFMVADSRGLTALSPEELDKSAELFDQVFAGLKNAEKNAMEFNGKVDLTENFKINGEPVSENVRILFRQYVKPSDKIKYEKAYILMKLADPSTRDQITYEGFKVASYDEIEKKALTGIERDKWRMEALGSNERSITIRPVIEAALQTTPQGVPEALKKQDFSVSTDLAALSPQDLEQAVQVFDQTFMKLKNAEQGALALYGKEDITDNFLYDRMSVSSTVKAMLKDKNLSDAELVKYQKALIVHAMADPERKKDLSYETFDFYRGKDGYTVTTSAQSESYDFTNVTESRRKQAEQEAKEQAEKQKPDLMLEEIDKFQMKEARILYAYRQKTGHWSRLSDIQTVRDALNFHFRRNNINESEYHFEYLGKDLSEDEKKDIEKAVGNMLATDAAAEQERQKERQLRQQALDAENALPKISDEQLSALRIKVKQMEDQGIDLGEYMDSFDHESYVENLDENYHAPLTPFEIARGCLKGGAYEQAIRKLPNRYFDEAMKALNHVEELADAAKKDPLKFDYADEKAEDLAYWFNSHEYSSITQNSLLNLKPVEERTNERGTKYTVFELTKDLNQVKLDRDKLPGLDVQAMEEAQTLFNENKEAFSKIFDIMNSRLHATYGIEAAWARDRLNELDRNEAGFDDPEMMKKLNRFRHLMYKIKIQDELVCKLGTDKKPVYVEPIHKLTDLSDEKAKLEESEILDQCYRDLKEPSERVSRNSQEYLDLMDSIKTLKETVRKDHGTDAEAKDAYVKELEHVLNLANHYYVHKAADGVKKDATLDKIVAVERISKTLKTRYKCITGKEFQDNISKEASLFGEPKQVKEDLTGDKYVLGVAGGKIEQMKNHIRDIKVAAAKDRKDFLKRARGEVAEEMAEARREAEKSHSRNSIGATQGKKATDKKATDKKTGNKKVKNDTKPVRRNSI